MPGNWTIDRQCQYEHMVRIELRTRFYFIYFAQILFVNVSFLKEEEVEKIENVLSFILDRNSYIPASKSEHMEDLKKPRWPYSTSIS